MAETELTRELLELEHRGWASLSDGTGDDFYGSLMTEDGVMVLANGAIADRAAVIEALRGSPPWQRLEIESARVVAGGPDAAVLVYTARAWRDESEDPFVGAMTSTYVRDGEGWRLAVYTQTPLP
jgi:hypothetical protein